MSDLYIDRDYHFSDVESQHQSDFHIYHDRDMKTLAQRLAKARIDSGMTQPELAKEAGVKNASTIGMLESGARLKSSYIPAMAKVLGLEALWLAEGKGQKYRDKNTEEDGSVPFVTPVPQQRRHEDADIQRVIEIMESLREKDRTIILGMVLAESRTLQTINAQANKAA